jgi:hypothetical protein|tara:strand:- start:13113 stop:13253 length:141 start_codon:yes stop_codon:yes gene_type:complete
MIGKFRKWANDRGLTIGEVLKLFFSTGFLFAFVVIMVYGMILSWFN